jgi:hypothetical protein
MNITADLSKRITKLIEDYITESSPDPNNLRQLAANEKVLPLICDWGGVFTINADGDIILFPFSVNANGDFTAFPFDNAEEPPRVESDQRIRNIALFGGSKKYPELQDLIVKPDDARTCPHCGGTGIDPYAAKLNTNAIVCYCGGLGWIP